MTQALLQPLTGLDEDSARLDSLDFDGGSASPYCPIRGIVPGTGLWQTDAEAPDEH